MGLQLSHSFFTKIDRFPPVVCRLLARTKTRGAGVKPMADAEIALLAGMTVSQVASLSRLTSWEDVPVKTLRAFSTACGVDFTSRTAMRQLTRYIKHQPSFAFLRKSPDWPTFRELMKIYAAEAR